MMIALFNPTTILVGFLLLYLSSFFIFAIVRIATGISIQRIGYFSLRRIAYAPRDGVQIEIRGLGLALHPPSFAQPTWISVRLTGLKVTLDLSKGKGRTKGTEHHFEGSETPSLPEDRSEQESNSATSDATRSKTWKTLTQLKEKVKRLHRQIHWLALVDVIAVNSTLRIQDVGQVQVGSVSLAVDTRRKMVDRGKVFRRKKDSSLEQRPAEWIMNINNVLLSVDGGEPTELLDHVGFNIHGHLHKDLDGLRDASVAAKIGRLHIPFDDLTSFMRRIQQFKRSAKGSTNDSEIENEMSFADFVEELDKPGSRDDAIVQTVADSKELASSLLRGIQEIQVALSFFRLSRSIEALSTDQDPMYLNIVSHEIGVDLHRMDQKSPAHRMYFQRTDVAHQALLAAISLSVSLDDSSGETDNILYIPMATTTIKTTLPSKTVSSTENYNPDERNTNILFANLVITSPSLDLEPQHVSRLLGLVQGRASPSRGKKRDNHHIISRLLPKASIKLSVHEPVVRFVLPVGTDSGATSDDDYSLLISSISSISLDIESSHSSEGGIHYALASVYRVASHQLYYQTPSGVKHNLLTTENMEFKVHLSASPEVCVIASGSLNACSAHMVNGEVNRGIRQVIEQFSAVLRPKKIMPSPAEERKPSILRRMPPWLLKFQFEATGFSLEIAGVDKDVSDVSRGVSLQLQSWTADYRAQKTEQNVISLARRRTPSHSTIGDESPFRFPPTSPPRQMQKGAADGRRLAIHVRGFEGFVIESDDYLEPEAFFSLPRFEVALSTLSDRLGPIFHINSMIKGIYLQYSLYRLYCLGIAMSVLQDAFMQGPSDKPDKEPPPDIKNAAPSMPPPRTPGPRNELTSIDVRATVVQVKATLPSDPKMMFQIYGVTAGSHRLSAPFLRAQLVRLHAEAPKLNGIWARIGSMNNVRIDLRKIKLKQGANLVEERSIDMWADFIRVGVPHHMVMHRIFDNIINTSKAIKQLRPRFTGHPAELETDREPEEPKKVPRVSLRSKALLFELEDDAFEWKLGCIYRTGLLEQRQRLAREEAFDLKVQKIKESNQQRGSSRLRAKSSHRTLRSERTTNEGKRRSKSADGHDDSNGKGRKFRYDTEGSTCLSSESKVSAEKAWYRLQEHNSANWKKKIDAALRFQDISVREIRSLFTGADEPPEDAKDTEPILAIPNRPGLMSALISDVNLVIDKPSFPFDDYPKFLHTIGKGMPMSMQYALLIPMSIQLDMGEARVTLRDYPLDLIHIPALRPGQPPRMPSWSLRTDFVIAEEFRDYKSARQVRLELVPSSPLPDGSMTSPVEIDVWRSVSPVKTYSNPTIEINTNLPTSISWGMSYQPVVQDMMKIIEGFTKPEIDPSDRVGFWDKIRLSFHSRLRVVWKEDGDVHLRLKGSRDPYVVTGFGAGFVMCWRRDVKWNIHTSDNPTEFMSVTSGEYVLAIPDYSHEARYAFEASAQDLESISASSDLKNAAHFKKVVMKLSGDVKWGAGLVFERIVDGDKRSSEFRPHYDVVLQNPKFVDSSVEPNYDAYNGFRSDYIHLNISVVAPESRDWSVDGVQPSASYNTVHLTPRFFTHFFSWWSLFSGVMSLPVRQGPLWPGITKAAKKFNRHLATVKYQLLFAPLFVAHIYKHKDREDYGEDAVVSTGLKVRLDSFKLDIHQRREQTHTQATTGPSNETKATAMRINQAQLDLLAADFRAVSARIEGTNAEDIEQNRDDIISSFQQPVAAVDLSRFTIPDHNLDWIDMDDFVELDWILPQESNPRTQILPLAFTPRFTYFRQTDHGEIAPGEDGYSQFGNEQTHECVMSETNDPRRVQMELIRDRLATVESQIRNYDRTIGEHELRMARDVDNNPDLKSQHELYLRQAESLSRRRNFLSGGLTRLERHLAKEEAQKKPENLASGNSSRSGTDTESTTESQESYLGGLYASPHDEFASDFNNRFVIHNVQLKWNNALRNIILRYGHQVSQRRGFVYYMSRRAVKFILDIVAEQSKHKPGHPSKPPSKSEDEPEAEDGDDESVEERIEQLLSDAKRYVYADDQADPPDAAKRKGSRDDSTANIAPEFTPQNSYHLRLIAPQIQLQSEKNQKSVLLVAAKGMQLKVVSIMDKERVSDDVSGLVQRRFSLEMDGAQFFVATQKKLMAHLQFYAGNKYGNPPGSAWPPWLTLEAMFDFELNPFGFSRIVQKTSASLRYDKYNNLRLKYNDEVAKGGSSTHNDRTANEARMDQIFVDFPHIRAICDSAEYYSMYIIVLDLLLYSEPLEKVRNERLEKIMLTSDFSDLRGAPEMVFKLQSRIQQLEEIKEHFEIHAKHLDKRGWDDRLSLEDDLAKCEDELFFMMKAITSSQRRAEPTMSEVNGILRWNISASEVVWHLMKDQSEPLIEIQLRNAEYDRTDNSDGSNHNEVAIERLYGLNLLSDAIYPQIIVPYLDQARKLDGAEDSMLRVKWHMLEAVAGIPVLDDFEVSLFPLKVQLEHELGQKVFEYIFPNVGSSAFDNGGFSPMMIKNMQPIDDSDDDDESPQPPPTSYTQGDFPSDYQQGTRGPGDIELRLQATLSLSDDKKAPSVRSNQRKGLGITPLTRDNNKLGADMTRQVTRPSTSGGLTKKRSADSMRILSKNGEKPQTSSGDIEEKSKKFTLSRDKNGKSKEGTDDLSQMMSRASNYMTLAHIKVHDVVLCLSYKGKGDHNLEDLHDFVFRLPVLEYHNKTWSNLDLALRLKKDVIKALISHAPAILGNKFSYNRPSKQQQKRMREREQANTSQVLQNSDSVANPSASDKTQSLASLDSNSEYSDSPSRRSFQSGASPLGRSNSIGSSMKSGYTQDRAASDSRSINEADVDSRWEQSRRFINPPSRPMTSSGIETSARARNWDGQDESQKMTFKSLGRKLMPSRK